MDRPEYSAMTRVTDTDIRNTPPHFWRRALSHGSLTIGGGIFLLIVIGAVFAPLLTGHDPYEQNLSNRLTPPVWLLGGGWEHWLGTDGLGRDYWSRLLHGARISLFIGFVSATIAAVIGIVLGVGAGYLGGRIDAIVTFFITLRLSMPVVLVALAVVALFGSSLSVVVIVLGALLWDRYAVVLRTATKQIKEKPFMAASISVGTSPLRIVTQDILPNLLNQIIVVWTLEVAHAILLEAALSFLGLGVQPPLPAWGLMVAEGKDMLFFDSWLITIPGVALFLLVLSVNLVGDGIRDVTAPENRD